MLERMLGAFQAASAAGETYLFLLPVYAALLLGERLAHGLCSRRPWDDRDAAANLVITAAHLGLDVLIGKLAPLGVMLWLYAHARLFELPGGAMGWLLAFLLHDLAWYVDHRLAHRVSLLWALHHVHHSSREYNMTVASRGFLLDDSVARPMFYLLPVLGVAPAQFIAIRIAVSVWGIVQHTRLVPRLGWLDFWLATPSNHRVHHGSDPQYLDRNYGEVLMLWDRLFGTYTAEAHEPSYGVHDAPLTYDPLRIQLAGLQWLRQRMRRFERAPDRLRSLVKPPEWEPAAPSALPAEVAAPHPKRHAA